MIATSKTKLLDTCWDISRVPYLLKSNILHSHVHSMYKLLYIYFTNRAQEKYFNPQYWDNLGNGRNPKQSLLPMLVCHSPFQYWDNILVVE